jgi:hypothetical protein
MDVPFLIHRLHGTYLNPMSPKSPNRLAFRRWLGLDPISSGHNFKAHSSIIIPTQPINYVLWIMNILLFVSAFHTLYLSRLCQNVFHMLRKEASFAAPVVIIYRTRPNVSILNMGYLSNIFGLVSRPILQTLPRRSFCPC